LTANPSRTLEGRKATVEELFARVKAEWETLTALGALAPYGPAP